MSFELFSAAMTSLVDSSASAAQIGGFLAAIRLCQIDRKPRYIAIAAEVMRKAALSVVYTGPTDHFAVNGYDGGLVDIVGTGGDGHNTFNVSTAAAIVSAGAGLRICKHGNKAATSSSGSADLLMALGCQLTHILPHTVPRVFSKGPFCFLLAPVYHPALAPLSPIRKSLGIPTIFNFLGPLLNPANISARIIGVADNDLGEVFAQSLLLMGCEQAMIVCGEEGLDELSISGPTQIWRIVKESRSIHQSVITPAAFGLKARPLSLVQSGTPEANAILLENLLSDEVEEGNAVRDFVLMNAAALLTVAGLAKDWIDGMRLARESLKNGNGKKALEQFREVSKEIAAEEEHHPKALSNIET